MILRNPQFLALLALIPALVATWYWRGRRVSGAALGLRLLAVAFIIGALSDPITQHSIATVSPLVLLVDQSDSLGEAGKTAMREQAAAVAQSRGGQTTVLYFGANTAAQQPTGGDPATETPSAAVRGDSTDIASALRAARAILGASGGRVALLSDGAQTRGDALAEVQALAAAGIAVDTLAYQTPDRPEIWVSQIDAPQTLREGEEYTINIVVNSTSATTAQMELFEGTRQLAAQEISLVAGENPFSYRSRAGQPGVLGLRVVITGRPDTFDRNNSAAATALVAPRPRVLLVESRSGAANQLRSALRPAGVLADIISASGLPAQLSDLAAYEGVVLVDVPAGDLTLDQMATLREFVRSEGRGLVATGGRASFTLGAYKDTPLEEVLPVSMTPRPRPERPAVSLLLIVDQSASMGPEIGTSKLTMAKESAILATEALREEDRIGVLAFDTTQQWAVEFQMLGSGLSLGQIHERISAIPMGGGTDIYAALNVGLPALAAQPGQVRHAVLLTDGRSFSTERSPYRALVDQARQQGITLSAIAIGSDSDTELLRELAQWGAGRYHFAGEPQDIPRLTLLESEIARTEPQVEGDFRADIAAAHPLLRDFTPNQIPRLAGYVATTLKPEAELVLRSPEDDPVLAAWQYGLGRAVAWTPSVDTPWAETWPNWPEYGAFWAQIIRYTLPEPDSGPLQIRVTPRGDAVTISADALAPSGEPLDLADTEATIRLPDGSEQRIRLQQTAPGHYAREVALPLDGAYAIDVRQQKDDDLRSASAGYVQRPSDEYVPSRGGPELLAQISAATGGQVLSDLATLAASAGVSQNEARGLWPWFLLAAALTWPLEIAVRRGWLPLSRRN